MARVKPKAKPKKPAKPGRDEKGRIVPGVSGNPSGRPKGAKSFGPAILAAAAEAVEKLNSTTPLVDLLVQDLADKKTRAFTLKTLAAYLPKEIKHSGEIGINFTEMTDEDLRRFVSEKLAAMGIGK
ncbi:MAG: hypothetical protein OEV92_03925 [Nitrospinota bacterium]|nr:hypothetical protein [Nitrospinota bacterium]